jgi:hypothetical protein
MSKKEEIQKLMEIAKKPLTKTLEIIKGDYNPAEKFSLMCEIKTDNSNYVPTYVIYEEYVNWCMDYNQEPINRNQFFKYFSLIFNRIKKGGSIVYLINSHIFTQITSSESEVMNSAKKNKKQKSSKKV